MDAFQRAQLVADLRDKIAEREAARDEAVAERIREKMVNANLLAARDVAHAEVVQALDTRIANLEVEKRDVENLLAININPDLARLNDIIATQEVVVNRLLPIEAKQIAQEEALIAVADILFFDASSEPWTADDFASAKSLTNVALPDREDY
jgi:hypothetical protein